MPQKPSRLVDYSLVSDLDWGRLAAYIDGEGCIRIHVNSKHTKRDTFHSVQITVAQKGPELIDWLVENFGGIRLVGKAYGKRPVMYYWRTASQQSYEVLKGCLPYMIVKPDQARIAIEYRETTGGNGSRVPPEIKLKREALRLQLYALKHGKEATVEISSTG